MEDDKDKWVSIRFIAIMITLISIQIQLIKILLLLNK